MRIGRVARLGLVALLAGASAPAQPKDAWRVLVLNDGDPYLPGATVQELAMRTALLEGAKRPVEFRVEFLDSVSFDVRRYEHELLALVQRKHGGIEVDLVAAIGPTALGFAERHRSELWPGAPIVFCSVMSGDPATKTPGADTTGVAIDFDEAGTLALARHLQPGARRLVVVSGASDYDRGWEPRLRDAVRRTGDGLEVTYLFGEPLPDVLRTVASLPRDAIVLYTTIARDGRGLPYVPRNVAEQLSQASTAPVYGVAETQVGHGVVGGSFVSMRRVGERAGALALRVLGGERAGSIPAEPPPPVAPLVDWRQLRRFGMTEEALPPGAVVLNRSPSLWQEYRHYIAAAALTLLVQAGLIVALLVQSRRRKQAELETLHQRGELAHAARLSAVGQLTASIAHEINQPLGAILSNAEAAELFLSGDPPQLERVRQILADIGDEDRRASEVIRRVRSLLRKTPPELQPLSLNDVVREVLGLVGGDALRRGIALEPDLSPLPQVRGDRVQLQQALLNLVLNAMEALEQAKPGERRIVVHTALADDGSVELVVSDTGPGIPEERLPQVFESFYTTKKDGMGLGLSIVRSIVEAHDGRIEAGRNGSRGAFFRLRLPAAAPTRQSTAI